MNDLTVGKEGKQILYFALPMLFGNIFQQLYSLVNSAVVGRFIGKEALAAVGASFPYIFALVSLVIGITMGGTIIISQYYGAKNFNAVKKTIDTLTVFLFISSIITTILGLLLSEKMLILIKLPKEIIPAAKLYLNIYFSGLIGLFGFNGISAILRGMGDSKTPLYFLIISNLINIGLDLLFILVFKWGFPEQLQQL